MNFSSKEFLTQHCQSILDFYEPNVYDTKGGFFQNFRDDGSVFDSTSRHLVSSTRFVFNYSEAYRLGFGEHYKNWAKHGVDYLTQYHFKPSTSHYIWQIGESNDDTAMAYGHAFVLLAGACALRIGIEDGKTLMDNAFKILEEQFFEESFQAYADEATGDLEELSSYRGQNANMHICECFVLAYNVTKEKKFLDKALMLAHRFADILANEAGGMIWEHYKKDWSIDWDYNKDKPNDLFKPWGFQPGHQVEWTKLLLQIHEHTQEQWLLTQAEKLFQNAVSKGWDEKYGGLVYGIAPNGDFSSAEKYFWVHAEAFAAAYRLFVVTNKPEYLDWYNKIWEYSWKYLIDHENGAWYRVRTREGKAIDNQKSPMGKVDYHTLGACWDVLEQLNKNQ